MYGNKVFTVGLALSALGLGYFIPAVVPAGAVVVVVGAVLVVIDR